MKIKNIHEKLSNCVQNLLIDYELDSAYYGEFNVNINFHEDNKVGTCGVNVTHKGMNFYYSPKFLDKLTQKEVNFIVLHEDFHLLFDHPARTALGQYDHKLSNIVQDMIINHLIWKDIPDFFVEIPKDKDGKNMALFVPKDYDGELYFESLYEWMLNKKEEREQKSNKCSSCQGTGKKSKSQEESEEKGEQDKGGSKGNQGNENPSNSEDNNGGQGGESSSNSEDNQNGEGNDNSNADNTDTEECDNCESCNGSGKEQLSEEESYGNYGKDARDQDGSIDTWSVDRILQDLENDKGGEYLDKHIDDEVSPQERKGMVSEVMDGLQARGLLTNNIEATLGELRKKRKDYLKSIKRAASSFLFGSNKIKTITRPNRKGISGFKGHKKVKVKLNCILDTSGSMGNTFERVLGYIYQNDIEVNLIEADTEVKWVEKIKNKRQLETIKIKGLGGTMLQPGVDFVSENFNKYNTLIITDGYCDSLDLSKLRGRVLILTIGQEVPITASSSKLKQIVLTEDFQ